MTHLNEIRARRAAIGETDWSCSKLDPWMSTAYILRIGENRVVNLLGDTSKAKAEFIAHALADIDTLLGEVERLQATLDESRELEPKTVQCEFCEMEILAKNVVRIGSHHHALCAGCAATYRTQETKDDESPF